MSLTHGVLQLLYWQSCCNVEIVASNSQRLHNIDATTSNHNVVPTLPQLWIKYSPHSRSWTLQWQRKYNAVTTILYSQRLFDVGIRTLHQRGLSFAKNGKCDLFMVAGEHLHNLASETLHLSGIQGRYCDTKSNPLFPSHTVKVPEYSFRKV